jgi:Uma2 family endonuclease
MSVSLAGFSQIKFRFPESGPIRIMAEDMSEEEFFEFCQINSALRIERDANGQIIVMSPTGSDTGNRNSDIHLEIGIWNKKHRLGKLFDSSTGFRLPNGAVLSPDVSWITNERWAALTKEERKKFAPLAPDFVLELLSDTQTLQELQEKMEEYISCGCRLGWLVDPKSRQTYVYEPNHEPFAVPFDQPLTGGAVLPGLEVRMGEVIKE